jgi:hypothetical protein
MQAWVADAEAERIEKTNKPLGAASLARQWLTKQPLQRNSHAGIRSVWRLLWPHLRHGLPDTATPICLSKSAITP